MGFFCILKYTFNSFEYLCTVDQLIFLTVTMFLDHCTLKYAGLVLLTQAFSVNVTLSPLDSNRDPKHGTQAWTQTWDSNMGLKLESHLV